VPMNLTVDFMHGGHPLVGDKEAWAIKETWPRCGMRLPQPLAHFSVA
jgi:hypothetical protein